MAYPTDITQPTIQASVLQALHCSIANRKRRCQQHEQEATTTLICSNGASYPGVSYPIDTYSTVFL